MLKLACPHTREVCHHAENHQVLQCQLELGQSPTSLQANPMPKVGTVCGMTLVCKGRGPEPPMHGWPGLRS